MPKTIRGVLEEMEQGFQNSLASASSFNDREFAKKKAESQIKARMDEGEIEKVFDNFNKHATTAYICSAHKKSLAHAIKQYVEGL